MCTLSKKNGLKSVFARQASIISTNITAQCIHPIPWFCAEIHTSRNHTCRSRTHQVLSLTDRVGADAAETQELRSALMDLQQLSAEHALVGKREAELMQARVAARTAERKCGEYQVRVRPCVV
jgi:hypothetical protein